MNDAMNEPSLPTPQTLPAGTTASDSASGAASDPPSTPETSKVPLLTDAAVHEDGHTPVVRPKCPAPPPRPPSATCNNQGPRLSKCYDCEKEFLQDKDCRHSRCPECRQAEIEKKEQEDMKKMEQVYAARWDRLCPPLYQKTDESQLPPALLRKVLSREYGSEGLVLHGETGTSKTRCMYQLLKKFVLDGFEVAGFEPTEFEHRCITEYSGDGSGPEWIERIREKDIVFLDDLLASKITPRVETELFALVDYRHSYELPILATTNHSQYQLQQQFGPNGERFLRRLLESVEWVSVPLAGDPV